MKLKNKKTNTTVRATTSSLGVVSQAKDYGRRMYDDLREEFSRAEGQAALTLLGQFMDSIADLPSPLKEEAFVGFCVKSAKKRQPKLQVLKAA